MYYCLWRLYFDSCLLYALICDKKRILFNWVGREAEATIEFRIVFGDENLNGSVSRMAWLKNSY